MAGPNLMPEMGPQKSWEPAKWTARHELICDLHIAGLDSIEIAQKVSLSEGRVSIILCDARAKIYIKRRRDSIVGNSLPDIYQRLVQLGHRAVDVLEDDIYQDFAGQTVKAADRSVRQKGAFGVLASLGYGPVNKSIQASVTAPPEALIEASKNAVAELKEMRGMFSYSAPKEEGVEEGECEVVDGEAA